MDIIGIWKGVNVTQDNYIIWDNLKDGGTARHNLVCNWQTFSNHSLITHSSSNYVHFFSFFLFCKTRINSFIYIYKYTTSHSVTFTGRRSDQVQTIGICHEKRYGQLLFESCRASETSKTINDRGGRSYLKLNRQHILTWIKF